MARFHVYRLRRDEVLAIDLQADLLEQLNTRVMAPLYSLSVSPWSLSRLNPHFEIGETIYVMATQRMAAVPVAEIGDLVADLSSRADDVLRAVDFLFSGY
ncbi:CcdB family protein [Rhizobium sp. NRK18]|uniref:CcdB family protein n=1 Tax=Rhizobium sp. NRK18 TaxID=2964667 RepID=UPI0021C41483|nr:CcdB family protein [Rhizobium sp. NRK18]MCQ2005681.1 CcdB family protein [Rhizobium sp. NRK18]